MNPRQHPKALLETYGIRPQKRLGQNFLTSQRALERILLAADLSLKDTILEIGSGLGTLTMALAQKAKRVVAIEKDPAMVKILQETLKGYRNVELIHGDVLKLSPKYQIHPVIRPGAQSNDWANTQYKVVANLPYYITSHVIRKFLELPNKPKLMVLMVQKEVAQRICAQPPDMNLLAVSVQFYGKPEIVSYVSKNSFWPAPKVDSAILRLKPMLKPTIVSFNTGLQSTFFRVVRAGFKQPRKQLGNNLKILGLPQQKLELWLKENGINPSQRAETLAMKNWLDLAKSFTMEE